MIVAFIDENRQSFGIEPICTVLQVSPSTYHTAKSRGVSVRAARDVVLKATILVVFAASYRVYGVLKMWKVPENFRSFHRVTVRRAS